MLRRLAVLLAGLVSFGVPVALFGVAPATATASGEGCPNEVLREERHETFLADCRAYEMVSPVDKAGGQVTLGAGSFRASSTGGAIVFDSNVATSETRGTGAFAGVTFRADRGTGGWTTRTLMPPQAVNIFGLFDGPNFGWFSSDLSHGLLLAGDPAPVADAPKGIPNLYLTDGYGGSPQLLSPSVNPVVLGPFSGPVAVDASKDFEKVAFQSPQALTSDAPQAEMNVYEWDHGTLLLEGILPNGTPAPEGAKAGPRQGANSADTEQAFSEDGKRFYFTTPNGRLYMRRDNSSTVWVSQSEASVPDSTPGVAIFRGASADGTRAVFMTSEHLLDADQDTGQDLYLYTDGPNPEAESNLTLISQDHEPADGTEAQVDGVLGDSRDGQRVYFVAERQIVAGGPIDIHPKLYVWDHGDVRYIASLVSSAAADDESNWEEQEIFRSSRVSADGRYLVFTTGAPLAPGFDNAGHKEVYRYDDVTDTLACVSCGAGPGPATTNASIELPGATGTLQYTSYETHPLSVDGQRVFFITDEALVPQDTNGKVDAYEWENGMLHLLSSGMGESDSYFVDASENGDDAYIATRERLVGLDTDSFLDVYDVRVDGGLPEPAQGSPPCAGEACQGVSMPVLSAPVPTSLSIGISGNSSAPAVKNVSVRSSSARKLAAALKVCKKRGKGRRKRCEALARRRYGRVASKSGGSR